MSNELIFLFQTIFSIIGFIIFLILILKIKMKKIYKIIGFLLSLLLLTTNSFANIYQLSNNKKNIVKEEIKNKTINKIETTQTQEFSKKDALEGLISLLKDVQNNELGIEKQLELIKDKNNDLNSIINKDSLNWIYLTDFMNNEDVQRTTIQILLSFIQQMKNNGNKDLNPIYTDYENIIYLDKETNTAQIPINIFTGTYGSISFEMVYINNQWRLSPYSLLESVSLSAQINEQKKDK